MRPPVALLATLVALSLALASCGGDAGPTDTIVPPASQTGTFALIQRTILTPSCAVSGCHVGASAAASGSLSMSADSAYDNLVGARSSNLAARRDGYLRVVPFKPDSSLLFQKTVLALAGHAAEYGSTMPVGAKPLRQGQVDLLRKWIEAGAPRTGDVVDPAVLANVAAQTASTFLPLSPPAPGTGIQIHVDSFGVHSNFERELFVYRPLGNSSEIYVNHIETEMRTMSHHLVLFGIDSTLAAGFPCMPALDVVRDIRNPDGSMNAPNMQAMGCHVYLGGSSLQKSDYRFPAGVALRLPAAMAIDMNVHYVNRTDAEVPGEAYANLFTVPRSEIQHVASTLQLSNTSFVLPPHQTTTVEQSFLMTKPTTIFMLTSHMHMMGKRFEIRLVGGARDGELVYENTDYAHPEFVNFPVPIVLAAGEGLRSIITYENTMDHVVKFGLLSTDEMGIIFGYYY